MIMQFRGQFHASNPERVSHALGGPKIHLIVINEHLQQLYTAEGRSRAFWGDAITGLNNEEPDVYNGWN